MNLTMWKRCTMNSTRRRPSGLWKLSHCLRCRSIRTNVLWFFMITCITQQSSTKQEPLKACSKARTITRRIPWVIWFVTLRGAMGLWTPSLQLRQRRTTLPREAWQSKNSVNHQGVWSRSWIFHQWKRWAKSQSNVRTMAPRLTLKNWVPVAISPRCQTW